MPTFETYTAGYTKDIISRIYHHMKTSWIAWALIIVIVIAGIWLFSTRTAASPIDEPSTSMGISGSANQGNLGGVDAGVVQQPGAAQQ